MTQEIGLRELLEQINARFEALERRMDSLERRMDSLERKTDSNFRWLVGLLFGVLVPMWVSIILAIVFRT